MNHYLISEPVTKTDRKHKRNFGISQKLVWKKNSMMVNVKSQSNLLLKFDLENISVNVNGLIIG